MIYYQIYFITFISDKLIIELQVLVQEPTKVLMPSYVQINWDEETKEVRLWHDYPESDCSKDHEWTFPATTIKGVR